MSKHGTKRGRPSLGPSPPAPKRANLSVSDSTTAASSFSSSRPGPAAAASSSSSSYRPSDPGFSTGDADLPGPATQRASLSVYDRAAVLIPGPIKNIWSFFQASPVPAPLPSPPRTSRKKRRTSQHREPEMRHVEGGASSRPLPPPPPAAAARSAPLPSHGALSSTPAPASTSDWRTSLGQSYAASIPLPPSPPRAREWLPSALSSSVTTSSSPSSSSRAVEHALERSRGVLHTPLRSVASRISKPTPGSSARTRVGGPAGSNGLPLGSSDGKSNKERVRKVLAKEFLLEQAQQKFREKQEQERKRIGHGVRVDSGVDKASFADLAQKIARLDSERERATHDKSSPLLREIKASGRPVREAPEDWVARLSLTEAKAQSARRPVPAHLPSYDQLLSEDQARDKKISERIASLQVERLPDDLTPEQNQEVRKLLADPSRVNRCQNAEVKRADLMLLRPQTWLNDEVMNFYCAMIVEACNARLKLADAWGEQQGLNTLKARRQWVGPKGELAMDVHAFSTFFFSKLEDPKAGYVKGRLNRWTKKVDIFKKDLVLVPINQGNAHWTCAVINFRFKRIEAYDSMGRANGARFVFKSLRQYLQLESQDKKNVDFDFDGWEDYSDHEITPQQLNGYDCGVFSCHFLEAVSIGAGCGNWSFGQENMPYLRKRMMLEIGRARLLNHPDAKP